MLDQLYSRVAPLLRTVSHLDRHEWLLVYGVLVVLGWFCLRGFGSRSSY